MTIAQDVYVAAMNGESSKIADIVGDALKQKMADHLQVKKMEIAGSLMGNSEATGDTDD